MKLKLFRILLFPALLFFVSPEAYAQELHELQELKVDSVIYKGIDFITEADWGEVLALAELEGKPIFLDAYTSWCRPCKVMDKEVFSRPDIGDLYNGNFLNVKMDMEEGQGIELAEQLKIIAYPSFFFIDYDGSVLHRSTGFKGPGKMLSMGRQAMTLERTTSSMAKRYEEGEKSSEFLLDYLQTSVEAGDGKHLQLLEEYLATQQDWDTEEIRAMLFKLVDAPETPLFDHIIANKADFITQFGASTVENKIQTIVYESLRKSENPLLVVDELFKKAYPERASQLAAAYKLKYHIDQENGQAYAKAAMAYINKFETNEEAFNEIAWNYYDLVSDKATLKPLFKSIKRKTKKSNTYLNNESLALLYAKRGKKNKARKLAKKAITLAKKTKISAASAEELLEELK